DRNVTGVQTCALPIWEIVNRTPSLGAGTEVIFVDGNSTDGTVDRIQETIASYEGPNTIRLIHQGEGVGKGDAVRKGFEAATGERSEERRVGKECRCGR